jgi:hypothetical protein
VILLAAVLVLVAVGLLAVGLIEGSATMQWASFAASALAAPVVVCGEVLRHVSTRRGRTEAAPGGGPPSAPDVPVQPVRRPAVPPPAPPADDHVAAMAPVAAVPADGGTPEPDPAGDAEPPVEEVEVSDLLVVLDVTDEVLVVDEHPRYHLAGCPHLTGSVTFPLPMVEARVDGFTPCGTCAPDHQLADRERARRAT